MNKQHIISMALVTMIAGSVSAMENNNMQTINDITEKNLQTLHGDWSMRQKDPKILKLFRSQLPNYWKKSSEMYKKYTLGWDEFINEEFIGTSLKNPTILDFFAYKALYLEKFKEDFRDDIIKSLLPFLSNHTLPLLLCHFLASEVVGDHFDSTFITVKRILRHKDHVKTLLDKGDNKEIKNHLKKIFDSNLRYTTSEAKEKKEHILQEIKTAFFEN